MYPLSNQAQRPKSTPCCCCCCCCGRTESEYKHQQLTTLRFGHQKRCLVTSLGSQRSADPLRHPLRPSRISEVRKKSPLWRAEHLHSDPWWSTRCTHGAPRREKQPMTRTLSQTDRPTQREADAPKTHCATRVLPEPLPRDDDGKHYMTEKREKRAQRA